MLRWLLHRLHVCRGKAHWRLVRTQESKATPLGYLRRVDTGVCVEWSDVARARWRQYAMKPRDRKE